MVVVGQEPAEVVSNIIVVAEQRVFRNVENLLSDHGRQHEALAPDTGSNVGNPLLIIDQPSVDSVVVNIVHLLTQLLLAPEDQQILPPEQTVDSLTAGVPDLNDSRVHHVIDQDQLTNTIIDLTWQILHHLMLLLIRLPESSLATVVVNCCSDLVIVECLNHSRETRTAITTSVHKLNTGRNSSFKSGVYRKSLTVDIICIVKSIVAPGSRLILLIMLEASEVVENIKSKILLILLRLVEDVRIEKVVNLMLIIYNIPRQRLSIVHIIVEAGILIIKLLSWNTEALTRCSIIPHFYLTLLENITIEF